MWQWKPQQLRYLSALTALLGLVAGFASMDSPRSAAAQEAASASSSTPTGAAIIVPAAVEAEVAFSPSRQILNVGDAWSITGEIQNRSKDRAIWIVDTRTVLIVAPEVFGDDSIRFGLPAIFPTMTYSELWADDQMVRIEAGSKYAVIWKLGARTPLGSIYGHSFFSPGPYRATAIVHYWLEPPRMNQVLDTDTSPVRNRIANINESSMITSTRDIAFDAALAVLLLGAAIGGMVALLLRASMRQQPLLLLPAEFKSPWRIIASITVAILLPVVATLLLARLSSAEAPIAIRVRDIWGAIATGFVVQWAGLPWLTGVLMPFSGGGKPAPTPQEKDQPESEPPTTAGQPSDANPSATAGGATNGKHTPSGGPTAASTP